MEYEFFEHRGHRLAYRTFGRGKRTTVLLPGLLLSQRMQWPLARALAERGHRVVCLDFLGHGASDRPTDMADYSMTAFGQQAVALLDHLGVERAVLGGTSLGANVTLEAAALAPDRLQGMLIEMPVLDNALLGCAIAFTPLLVALTFGSPAMRLLAAGARRIPRRPLPFLAEIGVDWASQDPKPSASVLQGLFFGRIAPPRALRQTLETPALVIGHPRDPIHPFSDADQLVADLPNGRLLNASSILELRISPERLTRAIGEFVDECWSPAPTRRRAQRGARRAQPRAAAAGY